MRKIIGIVDTHIVAEIAADDGAVIQAHRATQVMELEVIGRQLADTYKPEEFAVLHQFRRKIIRNQDMVPVARCIPVPHQHFDLISGELSITDAAPVLHVPEIIFVFSLRQIPALDK
jgi:hypothetical protein